MELEQWFKKGIDPDTYVESMQTHKENLLHVYDQFNLPKEDTESLHKIKEQNLRVIVLTEDWCGDAMLNIPILFRLAEKTNIKISLLLRDSNLELMDEYLTKGKARAIPIFIFIDEKGKEVAKWGPRAPEIQEFIEEATSKLPTKETTDFKEKQKEVFTFVTKAFKENNEFWDKVYQNLKQTLLKSI
ncbi:thioredoxin family protein [Aquibacillus halophilus]|uniref:Thioredoxin family protein n=1 Tax=Aquibacillus halophilus TaxID=930132 RepID=A0A6A8DGG4_9BACI|nr:thioredoxin family protein [Aquibacillus halophilus]MRH44775.1 thioredoxin family protein [Aquibacillus halophilus]